MKLSVAVASHETVPFLFAYDLAGLMSHTAAHLPEGWGLGIQAVTGTYIHKARQELIDDVLANDVDAVLFLDSDMRFPKQTLIHLLNRDLPVVGANYSQRGFPADYVGIKEIGQPGKKVATTPESEGVEEVEALGFGAILIRTNALRDMPDPEETPWFQNEHLGGTEWMGEDVFFCKLLRESGQRIFVDHDLSKQIMHIGQYEYDFMAPEFSKLMGMAAEDVKARLAEEADD